MKHIYPLTLLFLIVVNISFAQVNTSSTTWDPIGNVVITTVTDDADNGDGVGDGATFVDGQSTATGQGAAYTFGGTMQLGESITISTYTYNRNSSYVNLKVELYNKTNSRVLKTSPIIKHDGNDTTPVNTTLSYTAVSADNGDVLQIRYIRTDNGNTARDFAIDNILLVGPCPFTVTPDLPLIASNATIEAEINTAVDRFSDRYLGTNTPSANELSSAENAYAALNINVSGGTITGNTPSNFKEASFLKTFAKQLKFNPTDTNIKTKANNTVWWFSKQFCSGDLAIDNQLYSYEDFARPASLLKDFLDLNVKSLFEYTLYKHSVEFEHFWEPTFDTNYQINNNAINTDMIFNISDVMLAYSLWHNTPEERYRYMRAYKRFINRFFSYTSGTSEGIKVDGSGFHHWTAYNNYMYAYNTAANILSYLSGTSFQVDQANYQVFRNAFLTQYIQANDAGIQALSTAGRNPQSRTRPLSQSTLKRIAVVGGDILGLSTADPIFAGMHNRIYGSDAEFNYSTVAPFTEGFFQFNHAMAAAYRKNGWVVFNKGFSSNMWGSEAYPPQNRYGRYQSYGAQEVIYPGNKETGNGYDVNTWNWNYNPGTTVIRLPWANLHAERGRLDEEQQKRFVGALNLKNKGSELLTNNHGDYGMFAMDFQEKEGQGFSTTHSSENHNNTFTFKKSNFYFDDIIVCLASGINNNDTSNETITTLYQRLDNKGVSPNVNGVNQASSGEITYGGASNNWLLSNYNTGFYLLPGNHSLKVKKEVQQTPNQNQIWPVDFSSNPTATYYTGYIDHGTNPSNENYEYILMPNSNATAMQSLHTEIQGGNKPYVVHQQNANAHIVAHKAKDVWGYAFFNATVNLPYDKVTGVNASCLVMTENNNSTGRLLLSVVEPDVGFNSRSYSPSISVTKQITLKGEWTLTQSYDGVSIISSSAAETVVQFDLVNGLSKEILLEVVDYVNPDYPVVFYEDFQFDAGHGFTKQVVSQGGQATSEIMKRVTDVPDAVDSNGLFDPSTNRPSNRIPEGSASNQRAISTSGNNSTTNFGVDAYAVITTLDLTASNPLINGTDTYKYASFWTERRYGDGDIATITILASTAYTGDPATTTWSILPLHTGKIAKTSDGRKYVHGAVDLTSFANSSNGSNVTLAYRYQGSTTAHSGANRNGTFYFSDLQFYVQSVPLSVPLYISESALNQRIEVYPNPTNRILNIDVSDAAIQIKMVQLIDVSGRAIYTSKYTNTINVSNYSKGIYFLKLETTDGRVLNKKVVVNATKY
ncbi:polysaccharide lyase family 8 super-sandwich domain-containing protein [Polaribacter sp. IC073]|uniref:polysaccharide lyase family 8 super-sandwich domain-containing protein n=1 Tax=Polaribacter sp. IC073 TaxID=2508540 RepID=UPI0011BD908A|nr:polysaccharide lyase family 8 super-sandwich domain-containing protein [Polaribacter sp. IC073]TXD46761.1 T9SS type A sorting domain-containing protein [Polaribacter sp. IC073]